MKNTNGLNRGMGITDKSGSDDAVRTRGTAKRGRPVSRPAAPKKSSPNPSRKR